MSRHPTSVHGPSFAIHNVRAVLADTVLDDAVVIVEDGRIAEVSAGRGRPLGSLDGNGDFCLPGLVDCHSDGLEKEISPRPNVTLPVDFALRSYEARVRAAGVTTMFHGVGFQDGAHNSRTIVRAQLMVSALRERRQSTAALIDHRILYRLDARHPEGYEVLGVRFESDPDPLDPCPCVSYEDHTPGQGQYRDASKCREWIAGSDQYKGQNPDEVLAQVIADRDALSEHRDQNLNWLKERARAGQARVVCHDPTTEQDVIDAVNWPAAIAEFPTTIEAARAAVERGLPTVMGAPNVMRGGSHSGNVSAEELVVAGLCTALASDYQPATMLAAAFMLAQRGSASLPEAVRMVTSGPARMLGLDDRGLLAEGLRADIVLCRFDGQWPTVHHVWRAADPVFAAV